MEEPRKHERPNVGVNGNEQLFINDECADGAAF
jgi:hypothetical protein